MSKKKNSTPNMRKPKRRRKQSHRSKLFTEWMKMAKEHNKTKAHLYFVELSGEGETFLKIGVTTTSIYRRFKDLPYRFKRLKSVTADCKTVFQLETKVLRTFKKKRYYPSKKFSGFTECFQISAKKEILAYIKRIK